MWFLILLFGLGIYLAWTHVSGVELSTHTWEQRAFSFHRDPFTGWQISGVQHNAPVATGWWSTAANPKAKKIPTEIGKFLPKKSILPERWDLIRLEGTELPGGSASILIELLDAEDRSYQMFWTKWSSDFPKRAAIVWPAAHHLVEFDHYPQLPALLDLALLNNTLTELSTDVGQLVQSALLETCRQQQLSNPQLTLQAAEVGLQYGELPELRQFLE